MDVNNSITELLVQYQLLAIFFGAFLFGETVILAASFLAAQGLWSVFTVFVLALAGTLISDSLWFLLGQRILRWAHRWESHQKRSATLLPKLERFTGEKPFTALLFIKFLYGTRILTIVYLSVRKIPFSKFLFYNTIGSVVWLVVMISIGWLAGKSIINLAPVLNTVEYAVAAFVLLLILVRIGTQWFSKKVLEN